MMLSTEQTQYYLPDKKDLPLTAQSMSKWYANLLLELSEAGYPEREKLLLKDRRNYYGKYFDDDQRNFFLRHFGYNLNQAINFMMGIEGKRPRILEIGSGCGNQLLLMAMLGAEVVGCDIREDVCDFVKQRKRFYEGLTGRKLDITLICDDVCAVELEKWGKFDAINFLFSFNDMPGAEKMFKLINDVLRPGGRLVMQETNPLHCYNRVFRRGEDISPHVVVQYLEQLDFNIHSLKGGYALPPVAWKHFSEKVVLATDTFFCKALTLSVSYQLMAEKDKTCAKANLNGRKFLSGFPVNPETVVKERSRVLTVDGDILYAQIENRLAMSRDCGHIWEDLPVVLPSNQQVYSRLYSRLTRKGIHHLSMMKNGQMAVVGGKAIYTTLPGGKIKKSFGIKRGSRPLVMSQNNEGAFFWGEYFRNPGREEVSIYVSFDNAQSWGKIYTFKKNQVRHVHGVFCDPEENKIWITTGDDDKESGIWVTEDGFKTLKQVMGGRQQSRALQLMFTKEYIYFGTDTPFERNNIFRLNKATGKTENIFSVNASVYWWCAVGKWLFFSTAVEPSKVNKSSCASIWGTRDGDNWQFVAGFKKDYLPIKSFQVGQVLFPKGTNKTDCLFFTPLSIKGDQTIQRIRVSELF
ncbi:MAG: methyltransferase domain-containing protein [Candidatus Omnitrophota bacterium]